MRRHVGRGPHHGLVLRRGPCHTIEASEGDGAKPRGRSRNTVYATVMMTLNGIVGLCLILGGARHYEQSFQTNAAAAALSVLTTFA